jgi:uncharacterized protein
MLVFGALHILLLWNGDVLHQYALCGLLILPFLKRSRRTLERWVGGVLALRLVVMSIVAISTALKPPPAPGVGIGRMPDAALMSRWTQALIDGYSQPSWLAVARIRLWDYTQIVANMLAPMVVMLFFTFLVGLWIWSTGVLQDPARHRSTIHRVARWGLGLGIVMNVLSASMMPIMDVLRGHWGWAKVVLLPLIVSGSLGALVLALGIGAALVALWQDPVWRERLRPLTAVGRMGFTNYILQSVVCTFIFYGWGLGLYNHVGPARGAAIGVAIFAVQMLVSNWWVRRFHFGPLEWVWRSVTYWSAGPFRRGSGGAMPAAT